MSPPELTPQGIPILGMGTYPLDGEACIEAVLTAFDVGFRHIDTAQMYGNEAATGEAVQRSGLRREELFIVTKVMPGNIGKARFLASVRKSLDDLKVDRVDLLLIHWPPRDDFDGALDRLLEAHDKGYAERIGVSNFTIAQMEQAQKRAGGRLVNNQVEFQPLLDQSRLKAAADRLGMCLSAYSPLGRGLALKEPVVTGIAERLGRPPAEIVLRWIIQQGVVAIPMTTKRANAESNLRALEFELADAHMAAISALTKQNRRLINPSAWAPQWDS
jgi:diketogulonate reductase-like aldo/keto reductase